MSNLATSLSTATQIPLDKKLYVVTLAELQTLGQDNYKAFLYYEDMQINCVETHKQYIWREELESNEQGGLLINSFTYPINSIVNGIDYSERTFNFYLNQKFSDNEINKLKDLVYEKTIQSLSVSPTTFEKGIETDLVFTWNVDSKADTLNSVTIDGNNVTNEATGINRNYNVENQKETKSVSLISIVTENDTDEGETTRTTTKTSTALIPQYYGKVSNTPSLLYNDLQNHTKFLSSSSTKNITETFTNEKLFILSINANATILDGNGFNVTPAFTKSTVIMKLADGSDQSITQYLLTNPLNSTGTYIIN